MLFYTYWTENDFDDSDLNHDYSEDRGYYDDDYFWLNDSPVLNQNLSSPIQKQLFEPLHIYRGQKLKSIFKTPDGNVIELN